MAGYYIYLIASLPMLHFGAKPPFSFKRFLGICQAQLSEADTNILKSTLEIGQNLSQSIRPTLKKWYSFDVSLRNELARIRAGRKKLEPFKYLRADGYTEPAIAHLALNAYRNPSILEAEKMLDEARWRFLDELAVGHYFDLDFLLVYALKLLILERWERINAADKADVLEETLR